MISEALPKKELLQRQGHVPTDYPETVATTWSLNFQKVEQANPAAADLLRLCAFLEPDTIHEELISKGSAHLGPVLGPVAMETLMLNEAIKELREFSLLQRHPETRVLQVHRLVQAVLKDTMKGDAQRQWAERAVYATAEAMGVSPQSVARWEQGRAIPQAAVRLLLFWTSAAAREALQAGVAVPGFPEYGVARWAIPQKECHVLVLPGLLEIFAFSESTWRLTSSACHTPRLILLSSTLEKLCNIHIDHS